MDEILKQEFSERPEEEIKCPGAGVERSECSLPGLIASNLTPPDLCVCTPDRKTHSTDRSDATRTPYRHKELGNKPVKSYAEFSPLSFFIV